MLNYGLEVFINKYSCGYSPPIYNLTCTALSSNG